MDRAGPYVLLEELPEGGIGRIFRARRSDEEPDSEPCIVKVVQERFRRNAFFTATLMSEATSAVRFRHPQALATLKVGDEEGHLYIASECASGPTWLSVRDRARGAGRTFSTDAILYLGVQVATLLQTAHQRPWADGEGPGMLVAQMAPQSWFISQTGEVQVAGIGLGRSRSCLPPTRPRLPFRAPELFLREPASTATDVYGLGVVLYEAFSPSLPFDRDTVADVKAAVLYEPPEPLPHVAPELDAMLRSMMAKRPEDRPTEWTSVVKTFQRHMTRSSAALAAEWAEHVRILFSELDPQTSSVDVARRVPVRSVPYSQSHGPSCRPSQGPSRSRDVPGPLGPESARSARGESRGHRGRASGPAPRLRPSSNRAGEGLPEMAAQVFSGDLESGPQSYDIDDLALALESGDIDAAVSEPTSRNGYGSIPAPSESLGREPGRVDLGGLEDERSAFDVDSVVNAILTSRPPRSAAPPNRPPESSTNDDLVVEHHRYSDDPFEDLSADLSPSLEPRGLSTSGSDDMMPRPAPEPPPETAPPAVLRRLTADIGAEPSAPSVSPPSQSPGDFDRGAAEGARWPQHPPSPGPSRPPPDPWSEGPSSQPSGERSPWEASSSPPVALDPPDEDRTSLRAGDVIQDRYRVIEELGRGGMSIVYRAEHMLLLKRVALKLLRPELCLLPNVVERFQREARSVCRLDDPNIVRVTDFGRTEDGLLYLVMDLIEGESLAGFIAEHGPVPVAQATGVVRQILSGLAHAHSFEIVHRDLKPENIMLVQGRRLQVKILDFGIAKLGGTDHQSITQAGTVFGTPRYMSPEQAAGESVDHRTDLYTIGVILYQLLTGHVPFDGESTVQLLAKVLTQAPPTMEFEADSPAIRDHLRAVTMKALAKEPEDRFTSAKAFLEALDGIRVA
ncbi:MAG: protein kinase [Myxococcota bacterium]